MCLCDISLHRSREGWGLGAGADFSSGSRIREVELCGVCWHLRKKKPTFSKGRPANHCHKCRIGALKWEWGCEGFGGAPSAMQRDFGLGKASPCESQLINKVLKIRIAAQRRTLNCLYIEIGHQKEIPSIHERGKLKRSDPSLSFIPTVCHTRDICWKEQANVTVS